jgi:hypothetical protein
MTLIKMTNCQKHHINVRLFFIEETSYKNDKQ